MLKHNCTKKFKMKKLIIKSFATRLSLAIIALTVLIFLFTFSLFYTFSKETITEAELEAADNTLTITTQKIESILNETEAAIENYVWLLESRKNNPEELMGIIKTFVEVNENIAGSCIAFEPFVYPERGEYFMTYAHKTLKGVEGKLLGGTDYDYHCMDWYLIPKMLKQNYWSEPYFDEGGGNMIMTTFSRPLYDENGNIFAIFTADLSLRWFTTMVAQLKPYERSYTFMLSRNGYYLTHKSPERIMNETIFSATMNMKDTKVREIGEDMVSGLKGHREFMNDDTLAFAFYAPIPSAGWSVCMVTPHDEIFSGLNKMTTNISIISIAGIILLFGFSLRVIRRLTKPLTQFSKSAQQIATGDFNVPLPIITTDDEMKELHDSFEYLQHSLTHYIDELKKTTSTKERIESELSIAREIQMGMIPKIFPPFPERQDVDLYAILQPAKEVGGDLYDFFIDSNQLYFAIGDVSGKGVPASLFMAVTRSLFRSVATHFADPAQIVESMNISVSENNESNMFVTLFVGILDLDNGLMRYCNAGHNPPVLITPDGDVNYMEVKPNIPVGLFDMFPFASESCTIGRGTTIFLYTDGLTEAENIDQELYSDPKLLDVLRVEPKLGPRCMIEMVKNSVEEHVGEAEQSDDMTILTINYL